MKLAVVTEDGTTISQHFGRAPYYMVLTLKDGKVICREKRDKAGHHTFASHAHGDCSHDERHGISPDAQNKHEAMAKGIDDCQVLLAGGMGWGAYESLRNRGLDTIVTDIQDIEEATELYLNGQLQNLMDRIH